MYCTNCGSEIPSVSKFCIFCGKPVTPLTHIPAPESAPAEDTAQTAGVQTAPEAPRETPADEKAKRAYNLSTSATMLTMGIHSMVSTAGISVISAVVSAVIIALGILQQFGGDNPVIDLPDVLGMLQDGSIYDFIESHLYLVMIVIALYVAFYAAGMVIGILVAGIIRKRVPAVPPKKRKLSFPTFLLVVLVSFGFWGVGALLGNGPALFETTEAGGMDLGYAMIPFHLLTVIGAPVFEELIFRKFLLDRLAPFGSGLAVFFSALAFGMAHQNGLQFFLAFFIGLIFAAVYLYTGRVIYTMLLHGMINLFATLQSVGSGLFGNVFNTVWLIVAGILTLAGLIVFLIIRKHEMFRIPASDFDVYSRYAVSGWAFRMAKILVTVSVIEQGLLYAILFITEGSVAAGLYVFFPTALAVVSIFVLPRVVSSRIERNALRALESAAVTDAGPDPVPVPEIPREPHRGEETAAEPTGETDISET